MTPDLRLRIVNRMDSRRTKALLCPCGGLLLSMPERAASGHTALLTIIAWSLFATVASVQPLASADEPDAAQLVEQVVARAGGEEKLLKLFRFRERVLITDTAAAPPTVDEKENRTSVVQVGGDWWIGANKRDKDKVRVLCWSWSLRILLGPKSKIERLPAAKIGDTPVVGLRVSESIAEPIDLWFDSEQKQLVAIDYTDTRHIFSEWKMTPEGHKYPAHVVGHRFADRAAKTVHDKQWYQTDILELTPLAELPEGLK